MDKNVLIDELKAKITALGSLKESLKAEAAELEAKIEEVDARQAALSGTMEFYSDDAVKIEVDQEPKAVRNKSYALLQALGHKMHYSVIYKVLSQMGIEIGGQDPQKNLVAHLSQDSRFKSLGEGNWGLSEWPSVSVAATPVAPTKTFTVETPRPPTAAETPIGVLAALKEKGVTLGLNSEQKLIAASGDYSAVPKELQDAVGRNRAAIVSLLSIGNPLNKTVNAPATS